MSPSFSYHDGGVHITILSTLHANILTTRGDIENGQRCSFLFYQILHLRSASFLGELSLQARLHGHVEPAIIGKILIEISYASQTTVPVCMGQIVFVFLQLTTAAP